MLLTGVACIVAVPASSPARAAGSIYRVDDSAAPGGNGATWGTAYDDLQDALAVAGDGDSIWVAGGVYVPGSTRADSFVLSADIQLLGGFTGTESNAAQRDPAANITTLSGEIGTVAHDDNIYNVVSTDSGLTGGEATISGFRITRGHAGDPSPSVNAFGGGVLIEHGRVTLDQLDVTDNWADGDGAGIAVRSSNNGVTITDSVVSLNDGPYNSSALAFLFSTDQVPHRVDNVIVEQNLRTGITIVSEDVDIVNSVIQDNESEFGSFSRGVSISGGDVNLANTIIRRNGRSNGAGLYIKPQGSNATVTATNVVIVENIATEQGGALSIAGSQATLSPFGDLFATFIGHNVTIARNVSQFGMGAQFTVDGALGNISGLPLVHVELHNSIVTQIGSTATNSYWGEMDRVTWTNSDVEGSGGSDAWDADYGNDGGNNLDADPEFSGPFSDDYRIRIGQGSLGAGDPSLLPADEADVDGDGNTVEEIPLDLDGDTRTSDFGLTLGAYQNPTCSPGTTRLYVDIDSTGTDSGTTWLNALNDLGRTLIGVPFCDNYPDVDVWVSEGTYLPTVGGGGRSNTFIMPADVDVYGGFAGVGDSLAARNPLANPTILSGDLGTPIVSTDNAYRVVSFDNGAAGRLDGFTVRGGTANGAGADAAGAGIGIESGTAVLANLVVENNDADGNAGGILVSGKAIATVQNSIIRSNDAGADGGAIDTTDLTAVTVTNTLVANNDSGGIAGGISADGAISIFSSTIAGNTARTYGGLSVTKTGRTAGTIANTIIWGNSPAASGVTDSGHLVVYSNIEASNPTGRWSGPGANSGNNRALDPGFVNAAGGDFRLASTSPLLNVGATAHLVVDTYDVDDDGNTAEYAPDLIGNNRLTSTAPEPGAYEFDSDDADSDGISDVNDNCPAVPNADQSNLDGDSQGDACDLDDDGDGVNDVSDNCPANANADQSNLDGDGQGDACDLDDDGDGVPDVDDNCPTDSNPDQTNTDGGLAGDACDPDLDGDSTPNETDNCPNIPNFDQRNNDGDSLGDACDPDDDNDTVIDTSDNCPLVANTDQADTDDDGAGDVCDGDTDGDGVGDDIDNCLVVFNPDQANLDGDLAGDACDQNDDNDAWGDIVDNCPRTPNDDQLDSDDDGVGDACEGDRDGDTIVDENDNCPTTANTDQADADKDGIGDVCDPTPGTDPGTPAVFVSISPVRLVETRSGDKFQTIDDQYEGDGTVKAGTTYRVKIAGRGTIPATARAAVLNLTTVAPQAAGFLTIFPCGTQPKASGINFTAGAVVNNEIITKLSAAGEICIYASAETHVVIDAVGSAPATSPYVPVEPARIVETRVGDKFQTVDDQYEGDGTIATGTTYRVKIAGRGGIDPDAAAAVLNLTTVAPVTAGFLTIFPCGTQPKASGINYTAGAVVNNEIITKLSATGEICIFASAETHVVIDAAGYIPAGAAYTPITPARIVETRIGPKFQTVDDQYEGDGTITTGTTYRVKIAGRGSVDPNATAATLNLTTVAPATAGFLTIFPCGTQPKASGINYTAGAVVNNEIITKLSPQGEICIFASAETHLVIDATGWL